MNKTEICNYALTLIGEARVTDAETPQDESGRLISLLYDQTVHEILMGRDFRCAMERAAIAANSTAPAFGYETSYPMPNDWLRMAQDRTYMRDGSMVIDYSVTVDDNNDTPVDDWVIEGRNLMTNQTDDDDELQIVYIKQITNPGSFHPHVVKLIAHELADKMLFKRSQNLKTAQLFMAKLEQTRYEVWGIEARMCYVEEANNEWQKANR